MNTFNRCNCKPILKSELPPILQKEVATSYLVMISEEQRQILVEAMKYAEYGNHSAGLEEGDTLLELLQELPAEEASIKEYGVIHGLCL